MAVLERIGQKAYHRGAIIDCNAIPRYEQIHFKGTAHNGGYLFAYNIVQITG